MNTELDFSFNIATWLNQNVLGQLMAKPQPPLGEGRWDEELSNAQQ